MKNLLKDSNFIDTPQATEERQLKVDVFGNIQQAKVADKIIEIANKKAKEMPVIIMLKDV